MEKQWKDMSPSEKRQARFRKWLAAEGIRFESPEAETRYRAAIERFKHVALLDKVPDRVPVMALGTFLPTQLCGVTPYEAMYDTDKLLAAHLSFLEEYRPDYAGSPHLAGLGSIFDVLDYRQYKWPGHGLPRESGYQYVETEYMLANEYDALIDDPSDFWIRKYLR